MRDTCELQEELQLNLARRSGTVQISLYVILSNCSILLFRHTNFTAGWAHDNISITLSTGSAYLAVNQATYLTYYESPLIRSPHSSITTLHISFEVQLSNAIPGSCSVRTIPRAGRQAGRQAGRHIYIIGSSTKSSLLH